MNFERRTKQRLSDYKANLLGVTEDGTFVYRGEIQGYSHILPKSNIKLNIIPSIREKFWNWFAEQEIALHQYFHHLNSSQALCFNLFFPLLIEGSPGLTAFLTSIGVPDAAGRNAAFEFVPDPHENTHFDFMIPLRSRARVYFEIKYTEAAYSSANRDAEHLSKFERVYRPKLDGRLEERFCDCSMFLEHYQVLRNVWHLDHDRGDYLVFLFPKANEMLRRGEAVIRSCALAPYRSRIKIVLSGRPNFRPRA